jgi:ABC-type phosphate transport system substrate-binding protein
MRDKRNGTPRTTGRRRAGLLLLAALATPILWCVSSGPLGAQSADALMVVVSPRNLAGGTLNKADFKKILMGDTTSWPNGSQIPVIMGPPGDADRTAVLKKVCNMDESLFTRRQMQASFSGGTPVVVREVRSAAEVKAALRGTPLGIGFLHKRDVDDSVKVVFAVE